MTELEFQLLRWVAWAPGLTTEQDWQLWARGEKCIEDDGGSPALPQVKPMLRRRFSRLTRMALHACFECLGSEREHSVRTVFCSPHGEIHRTRALLDDIVKGEPISPMGFSLSVHNTASGLYSIASGNTAPSIAIAAGVDTLEMAVVDALGHLREQSLREQSLQQQPESPVLVVFADEPLPEVYREYVSERTAPHALALLLSVGSDHGVPISLAKSASISGAEEESHGLALARWLSGDQAHCRLRGERFAWQWARRYA